MLVDTSDGLMCDTSDEVRDAWDARRLPVMSWSIHGDAGRPRRAQSGEGRDLIEEYNLET